ncbi:S-layer homology domain-containing protein [Solibacillus silvestris]
MKNKLFITALAASIVVPAVVVPMETQAATKSFSDVSTKNPYYDIINVMTSKGIIKGYENGTFKPNETLSRKHAATLINRAVTLKSVKNVAVPKDLTKSNAYYTDIIALLNAGLIDVDSKGNVNPNKALSRGEMAKILATAFNLKGTKHSLKDVSKTYDAYVAALYENNVTTGFEDGTFKEKQSLTRSHYAVFMYRAMGLDKGTGGEQKPTTPSKNGITMNSSEKEINDYIKSSNLFKKGIEMPHPVAVKEYDGYKEVIVNMENILAGTDLKVTNMLAGSMNFNVTNWKPVSKLLTTPVIYVGDEDKTFQKISFDHTMPQSQEVAKRILETVYKNDFDTTEVSRVIDEKVKEAIESKEKWFTNFEAITVDGFTLKIGVQRDNEYNHFMLELDK